MSQKIRPCSLLCTQYPSSTKPCIHPRVRDLERPVNSRAGDARQTKLGLFIFAANAIAGDGIFSSQVTSEDEVCTRSCHLPGGEIRRRRSDREYIEAKTIGWRSYNLPLQMSKCEMQTSDVCRGDMFCLGRVLRAFFTVVSYTVSSPRLQSPNMRQQDIGATFPGVCIESPSTATGTNRTVAEVHIQPG